LSLAIAIIKFSAHFHKLEDNIKIYIKGMVGESGVDSCSSRQGLVAGFCEHSNELSGFTKGREFLD
jgi:hypothetical protein